MNLLEQRRAALRETMERLGLNAHSWAQKAGVPESTLRSYFNGKTDSLRGITETKLANAVGLNVAALYGESYSPTRKRVWVKGRVGAGARIQVMDAMGETDGMYEVDFPPGVLPTTDLVAFELSGFSMPPAQDRWIIYCEKRDAVDPAEVIGRACVVETAAGELLFKVVRRGYEFGRYNLESWDGSPLRENVELLRAQPFVAVADPAIVRK